MRRRSLIIAAIVAAAFASLSPAQRVHETFVTADEALSTRATIAQRSGVDTSGSAGTTSVVPSTSTYADGSVETSYALPDGQAMRVMTPPSGFDPLTASVGQLQEYGFPLAPQGGEPLQDWIRAMSDYVSDPAPSGPLEVATAPAATSAATLYGSNWSGYIAGSMNTQSHTYVALKADLTVPSASACSSDVNTVSFWVGLGGTTSNPDNLIQQGVVCGDSDVGSGGAFRPFTEFADTQDPIAFRSYTSWTIPAGHVVYQNMSHQASSNTAYFYLEDEASGTTHSCSSTGPKGWAYDDNTAEWIAEAPTSEAAKLNAAPFSDADTARTPNLIPPARG